VSGSPLIVVGLGNPGRRYEDTRHNAGFWFADRLAALGGGSFRPEKRYHGELARVDIDGCDVRILKPQTYMNRSGQAAAALLSFLKLSPDALIVAHDELDLPPGTARFKRGGGAGGHNGLRDLIAHLGGDFWRLRLGIGHPGHRDGVLDYVLTRPSAEDRTAIDEALDAAVDAYRVMLSDGAERAMSRLHARGRRPKPHRSAAGAGEEEP
jgi:PTH1 family peptidyl-tRNA hydrolase